MSYAAVHDNSLWLAVRVSLAEANSSPPVRKMASVSTTGSLSLMLRPVVSLSDQRPQLYEVVRLLLRPAFCKNRDQKSPEVCQRAARRM